MNSDSLPESKTPSKVVSVITDSGVFITGLVYHCVTPILLDTGATVSVLSEEVWRKSLRISKLSPVSETLTTANGDIITVLGETNVRLCLGEFEGDWNLIIAQGLTHDCILGSDFFQHHRCQICYDTRTFSILETEVPIRLQMGNPVACRVYLKQDVVIEPGVEQLVNVTLEGGFEKNNGSPGILAFHPRDLLLDNGC